VPIRFRTDPLKFVNNPSCDLPNLNRGENAFERISSLAPGNEARDAGPGE
jgi:hypothetical protein